MEIAVCYVLSTLSTLVRSPCNVHLVEEGRQKEEADGAAEPAHEVAGDGAGHALRVQEAVVQSSGVNVRAERSL